MDKLPFSRRDYLKSGAVGIGVGLGAIGQVTGQIDSEINWGVVPTPVHENTSIVVHMYEFPDIGIDPIYIDVQNEESQESILSQPLVEISRQEVKETLGFRTELQVESVEANDEVAIRLYADESRSTEALLDEQIQTVSAARVDATAFVSEEAVSLDINDRVHINFKLITEDGRSEELGSQGISDTVSEIPERLDSSPWTGELPGTGHWIGVQPEEHNGQNSRLVASVDTQRSDPDNAHRLVVSNPERGTDLTLGEVQQEAFIVVESADTDAGNGLDGGGSNSTGATDGGETVGVTSGDGSEDAGDRGSAESTAAVFRQFSNAAGSQIIRGIAGVGGIGVVYAGYKKLNSDENKGSNSEDIGNKQSENNVFDGNNETPIVTAYDDIKLLNIIKEENGIQIQRAIATDRHLWIVTPASNTGKTIDSTEIEWFDNILNQWTGMDNHPHLLSIYATGNKPFPWVAIKPANNPTLLERINDLTFEETVDTLVQLCQAVHHVQRYGQSYGRLSPESVLIDEDNQVRLRGVLDYLEGISDTYDLPTTEEDATTEQADVYRLGALTYEILTETRPEHPTPASPSEIEPSLPTAIDTFLSKALARAPNDRYETVLHFRDELQELSN